MVLFKMHWAAVALLVVGAACAPAPEKFSNSTVSTMSLDDFDTQLQQCSIVQALNAEKAAHAETTSSFTSQLFGVLFPGSPAVNALLGTLYISGPPNFLLALCPPNIDPSSLSIMVAFAVGGIMGDTLFHLLPEIFLGEESPDQARLVLVEPNRNLLLGVAILVGFMTFVAMDKGLRIAMGGEAHSHSHGHGHGEKAALEGASASSSALDAPAVTGGVTKRVKGGEPSQAKLVAPTDVKPTQEPAEARKLGGLLNLIADFTHNITDGLAMSASFYASPTVGAMTCLSICTHELPHEVGDFALLIQSGFSKRQAIGAQFITAIGAFVGTLAGIAIQEFGGNGGQSIGMREGLLGTSLTWGDMLLPFTAGTFLYVGTVAVIPELLETGPNKGQEMRKTLVQFLAIAAGAGIMLVISWHE